MVTMRFMQNFVTDGATKARISYSAGVCYRGTFVPGTPRETAKAVTLYAKGYEDGNALGLLFPAGYVNNTDSMTDYFERGRVTFFEDSPFYAVALARAEANEVARLARREGVVVRRLAKREKANEIARLGGAR